MRYVLWEVIKVMLRSERNVIKWERPIRSSEGQRKTFNVFLFYLTTLSRSQPIQRPVVRWLQAWPIRRQYLCICLERLRRITTKSHLKWYAVWELNPWQKDYEARVPYFRLRPLIGKNAKVGFGYKKVDSLEQRLYITSQRNCQNVHFYPCRFLSCLPPSDFPSNLVVDPLSKLYS